MAGHVLSKEEEAFFSSVQPLGYILFARNCGNPAQLRELVQNLRAISRHEAVPILIDQEGGRVARLRPPHWRESPPAAKLASLCQFSEAQAKEAIYLNAQLIAHELIALGINVNCAPVADILIEGAHDIVGDRAYGSDPAQVGSRARAMAEGLMAGGVLPVVKHIPGHGRALADSHEKLPVVDTPLEELRRTDFVPFKMLNDLPFAMTAHVLYTAIDRERLATVSPAAIRVIREEIGFTGVLMSDDLSMRAMSGGFEERARETLAAGCDIVLHCNGDMKEMAAISPSLRPISETVMRKVKKAFDSLPASSQFNAAGAEARLHDMLRRVA